MYFTGQLVLNAFCLLWLHLLRPIIMAAMRSILLAIMFAAVLDVATPRSAHCVEGANLSLRYGVRADTARYPQSKPAETLKSVLRAVKASDIEYLLAQLILPDEVDEKFRGSRKQLLGLAEKSTAAKSQRLIDALDRHIDQGRWTAGPDSARCRTKGLPDVTLSRLGNRWFMHNVPGEK